MTLVEEVAAVRRKLDSVAAEGKAAPFRTVAYSQNLGSYEEML